MGWTDEGQSMLIYLRMMDADQTSWTLMKESSSTQFLGAFLKLQSFLCKRRSLLQCLQSTNPKKNTITTISTAQKATRIYWLCVWSSPSPIQLYSPTITNTSPFKPQIYPLLISPSFSPFFKAIPSQCGLVYNLKMERREQDDNELEDESSGLDYLVNNAPQEDHDSNEPKKKARNESEKDSEIRHVLINNLSKEKRVEGDSQHDGVYLYKPGVQLPSLYQFANQTVKIIIASEYIKRHNPQLLRRSIFGADPYTSNSDAVCMLVHSGSVNINTFQGRRFEGVELTCKVIKPKKNYSGCFKNGLLSRSLKGYNGNALKPETVRNLASLGPMELLERYAANMHIPIGKSRVKPRVRNIASIIPIPETHIVFNMNNEPAYKYSIFNIADKGFDRSEFMIKKLDNFVLYLETENHQKYELLKNLEMDVFDIFRFSRVKHPERIDNEFFEQHGCPLDDALIEVLFTSLEWDEILWGNSSVLLHGQLRVEGLRSFKYYKRASK